MTIRRRLASALSHSRQGNLLTAAMEEEALGDFDVDAQGDAAAVGAAICSWDGQMEKKSGVDTS